MIINRPTTIDPYIAIKSLRESMDGYYKVKLTDSELSDLLTEMAEIGKQLKAFEQIKIERSRRT